MKFIDVETIDDGQVTLNLKYLVAIECKGDGSYTILMRRRLRYQVHEKDMPFALHDFTNTHALDEQKV